MLTVVMSVPEILALLLVDGLIYREIEGPAVLLAENFEVQLGFVLAQFLAGS